jgi:hypothetical protein
MLFPWAPFAQKSKATTPREIMIDRLREGVPPELASRAAGIDWAIVKDDPEIDKALAEGEILLFERARDSGVTGVVRAALRNETKSWVPKAESQIGLSVEDYLRD